MLIISNKKKSMRLLKTYNDPIYGNIQLDEISDKIIKHKYFQRLRNIKQLGISYKVFANLTHTRFEHSIGVAHLCKFAAQHLNLDDKLIILVTIAGLLHDIGHGPQSHLFDTYVGKIFYDKKKIYEHETRSVEIFKKIVHDDKDLELYFSEDDVQFIEDMILGNIRNKFDRNRCIIELLNNKESKIDLDKLDYLIRDTYYYDSSVRYLNYEGIISGLRILNLNDSYELCYSSELKEEIDKLFERRFYNHYNIYQNLEVKKWELSYLELLSQNEYKIKNIFINNFDIDSFCKLTDDSFNIYKCTYKIYGNPFQNNDEIKIGKELFGSNLLCKDYEVNHGAKNENPVNRIIFYEKNNSIIKFNDNKKNYEEKFKYLCYKENLNHDLNKYKGIYDRLVGSHSFSFINTGL